VRKLILISLFSLLTARSPLGMDEFVIRYFILAKSSMESSPTLWQDLREGYSRNKGMRHAVQVLDSLDAKQISSYHAGIRHFKTMDSIRAEVMSGKEYELLMEKPVTPTYRVNYFSSVSK
tara:strand:+ start:4462 stop:4821 length:360 start_codon:yes stop_codon:yes gene_type:complete